MEWTDMEMALPPEMMEALRPPSVAVPEFATVVDQRTEELIPFNTDICPSLQNWVLSFLSAPPRDIDGYTMWAFVIGPRQSTKTTTTSLGMANLAEYTPGSYAAILADKDERSKDIFRTIQMSHQHKDPAVRYPSAPTREVNQLTFARPHNGKIRTLTALEDNVGIGRGASFLHMSELPFWRDPESVWFQLSPAFRNRKNALIVAESTPAPMSEPGAEWFKDMAEEAWMGNGRFVFLFVPFYDSILNERTWRKEWTLTNDEVKWLNQFGPKNGEPLSARGVPYLTLENLAFRRTVMTEDRRVRRDPDSFFVYYPIDRVSCWQQSGSGHIPSSLYRHLENRVMVPWNRGDFYKEYQEPEEDAVYVIGFDPSGYGTGDPASFQVLKCWADAPWEQVAEYETNEDDPPMQAYMVAKAAMRYNNALVVVENNVQGALTLLEQAHERSGVELLNRMGEMESVHIKRLLYSKVGLGTRPGVHANVKTKKEATERMLDILREGLIIRGDMTYAQIRSYRRDKQVQTPEQTKVIDPMAESRGRRKKHHWDRVSALMWACWARNDVPARNKPKPPDPDQEHPRDTLARMERFLAKNAPKKKRRRHTTRRAKYKLHGR